MRPLVKALFSQKKHLTLFIISLISLCGITIATQLEYGTLGVLANHGTDFFSLFGSSKNQKEIHLSEIESQWNAIDTEGKGAITRQDATVYMARAKRKNPLEFLLSTAKEKLRVDSNLGGIISLLICVAFFKAATLFFSRYSTQLLSIRISRDLRQHYFEHIQRLPMSFYQKYNIGSLSSRAVADAAQVSSSINSMIVNFLQTPFTFITSLGGCFYLSWKLTMVIFVALPLILFPIIFITRRVKRVSRQLLTNQEKFSSVLVDFLSGIQTVKIFAMEAFSLRKYKEQNDQMAHLESKSAKYGLLTRPILHTITTFCLAAIVLFGLYTLHMTLPELLVFAGLLHLVYEPIKKYAEENNNIQKGIVAAERMHEVLAIKPSIEDHKKARKVRTFSDALEFKEVWFRYGDNWVLKNLNFTVKKGETIALVGPTGAGKSSIVQLFPRLYDVQKGEISIDSIPLKECTQKSVRELISFVPQKPFLFLDTVAENIAYGKDFSREEIELAAKRAHAHEFITKLPQGYDTQLAEGGKNLSGGQQQRLAIARALVKKAPILILDEATSSLDALSERQIQKAILELHGQITQILIAHRLGTIEHADRIIYIEKGEKIAEGTKEELLMTCDPFRRTWNALYKKSEKAIV